MWFLILHCQLILDMVKTLEEVLEICSVTSLCCDHAKVLLGDYYPPILHHRQGLNLEKFHGGMSTFFRHKKVIITLAVATGIFLNGTYFFSFA